MHILRCWLRLVKKFRRVTAPAALGAAKRCSKCATGTFCCARKSGTRAPPRLPDIGRIYLMYVEVFTDREGRRCISISNTPFRNRRQDMPPTKYWHTVQESYVRRMDCVPVFRWRRAWRSAFRGVCLWICTVALTVMYIHLMYMRHRHVYNIYVV